MTRSTSFLLPIGAAALTMAALFACGGGDNGTTPTTTTATTTPTTLPAPVGLTCSPTPPPLYGINIKVHAGGDTNRKILDSKPMVWNVDNYCARIGAGSGYYCDARLEGDPSSVDCDRMAVGRASNGNWGPSWSWNGQPCPTDTNPGCSDDPNGNQFMLIARGPGRYEACAAADIPISNDPDRPGSRCHTCVIASGSGECENP